VTGEGALAKTLKANGVALAAGVYGDPCTSLLRSLSEAGLHVEISVEEKTAMAQAQGASVVGARAAAVFKQVGVNVASDPLVNAAIHGCGAGLLVFLGDDPGAAKSTTEQDSRWYARLSELPVLTPHNADHLCRSAVEGLELSEELGLPVLLQVTSRLTKATDPAGDYRARTQGRFDRDRPWGRFMLDRHKYLLQELYPKLLARVEDSALHRVKRTEGDDGVISCGGVSQLVQAENHFALGYAYPLPEKRLAQFLAGLKRVLVVEEVAPVVEEAVGALAAAQGLKVQVLGRLSGHLPRLGPLDQAQLDAAFSLHPRGWNFEVNVQPTGDIFQLPCGGFEPLYLALDAALPEGYPVAGDVGCSILHGYFPPQVIDTAYALGTSIATACGMSSNGRKGVAVIGDTGFLHSGVTALLNAVEHGHNVLVIIIHNAISGMTPGHLDIPGMHRIRALAVACGVDAIDECDVQTDAVESIQALIERRLGAHGVHVIIAKGKGKTWGS